MANIPETEQGEVASKVMDLIRLVGLKEVTDVLEVSRKEIHAMLMCEIDFPADAVANVDRLMTVLDAGRQTVGIGDELREDALTETDAPEVTPEQLELVPDAVLRREPAPVGSRGVVNQLMDDLYRTRMMALRHQMDLTLRREERISRQLLVVQIELTLILYFEESVPEPGLGWSAVKLSEESEKRLRRQRRLAAELDSYQRGFKGLMRKLVGRRPQTPRELMAEMKEEADLLHGVGDGESENSRQLLERVLQPTGLNPDMVRDIVEQHKETPVG